MQHIIDCHGNEDTYSFRPYQPSKVLITFLVSGAVFLIWLAINGVIYGMRYQRKDTIVFSMCLIIISLAILVLVSVLLHRSNVLVSVSHSGIMIKRGASEVLPVTSWKHFHKAYFLCDYQGKTYLVLSKKELLIGMRKELLLKLADNIPKVWTDDCVTLLLKSDTAEKIECMVNGAIPIERYK